jgi:hypothetical protein
MNSTANGRRQTADVSQSAIRNPKSEIKRARAVRKLLFKGEVLSVGNLDITYDGGLLHICRRGMQIMASLVRGNAAAITVMADGETVIAQKPAPLVMIGQGDSQRGGNSFGELLEK